MTISNYYLKLYNSYHNVLQLQEFLLFCEGHRMLPRKRFKTGNAPYHQICIDNSETTELAVYIIFSLDFAKIATVFFLNLNYLKTGGVKGTII